MYIPTYVCRCMKKFNAVKQLICILNLKYFAKMNNLGVRRWGKKKILNIFFFILIISFVAKLLQVYLDITK